MTRISFVAENLTHVLFCQCDPAVDFSSFCVCAHQRSSLIRRRHLGSSRNLCYGARDEPKESLRRALPIVNVRKIFELKENNVKICSSEWSNYYILYY